MSGACASTIMISLLAPTDGPISMTAAWPTVITRFLRDWAAKPTFSTLMSYAPGGNNGIRYSPLSSVSVDSRDVPVSALVTVTLEPGTAEPVGSVTRPLSVPAVLDCAEAIPPHSTAKMIHVQAWNFMAPPLNGIKYTPTHIDFKVRRAVSRLTLVSTRRLIGLHCPASSATLPKEQYPPGQPAP